jgi:hypothetical protein
VPIDIATEQVVNFREGARLCPGRRQGRKPHVSTFYRWARMGLETIRVGGQLCTSVEAMQRFFDRLTAASQTSRHSAHAPRRASCTQEQLETELAALGL